MTRGSVHLPRSRRRRDRLLLLLSMLAAALLAGIIGLSWARASRLADFEADARGLASQLQQELQTARSLLLALSTLYQRDTQIDAGALGLLARDLLESAPQIQLFTFQPLIDAGERSRLETEMNELGLPQFSVTHYDEGSRRIVPAESAAGPFLPIVTIEPLTPAITRYYGLDLLSLPGFEALPERMIAEKGPVTVQPPWFLDFQAPLLLVQPTFAGSTPPTTDQERRRHLRGALLFVLQPQLLLDELLESRPMLTARLVTGSGRVLAEHGGRFDGAPLALPFTHLEERVPLTGLPLTLVVSEHLGSRELSLGLVVAFMILSALLGGTLFLAWRNHQESVAERIRAQTRINEERRRAEITLRAIADGVFTTDLGLRIIAINPAGGQLVGRPREDLIDRPLFSVVSLLDEETGLPVEHLHGLLEHIDESHASRTVDLLLVRHDGRRIPVAVSISQFSDGFGNLAGFVLVLRDVSRERALTDELLWQATHDDLTGLLNRHAFENELEAALHSAQEQGHVHMLCYIDLDQFKLINDTCGHLAGDQVLKQVAALLKALLRERDILARLGGDEFGVLLPHCDPERAREIAERLREAVREYRFRWDDKLFDLRASIGVVPITSDTEALADLLAAADIACYAAKERGRDNVYLYSPEDLKLRERHGQMQWLPVLQQSLHEDRFTLHLQPIEPISDPRLPRLHEFLVRLRQNEGPDSLPGSFVPAAERYDLMKEIDRWVIINALNWISRGSPGDTDLFTINLSGQSIGDPGMADFLLEAMRRHGVPCDRICLEITETAAITNFTEAMSLIQRLREAGCRFALDDFGSGLSSFSYLKRMPLDLIKIDGQFVRDITTDRMDATIVRAVQDIAHTLGVRTIAEFVEDRETFDQLLAMGIDYAQGWFIGPARPLADFVSEAGSGERIPGN